MKAKKTSFRDDFTWNRLFFRLFPQGGRNLISFSKIKENLYKVHTVEGVFILKGYEDMQVVKSSLALSQLLHKRGFLLGLEYVRLSDTDYFIVEDNKYWTLTKYIPHKRKFSFSLEEDRICGIEVLKAFHASTEELVPALMSYIPKEKLLEKWDKRLQLFIGNTPFLSQWFNSSVIEEIVYYSNKSLEAIKERKGPNIVEKDVVLHGDLASHNFIKSIDNHVYMIDYDLISIGNKDWDYVQYANRVLPFIKWDVEKFGRLSRFHQFEQDHWLWSALSFPMDILREGNQFSNYETGHFMPTSFASLSFFISTWEQRKLFLTNYDYMIQ